MVVTPEAAAVDISEMWSTRTGLPTLFVLPKWQIEPDRDHKGWVRIRDLLPASEPEGVFAPGLEFEIKRHARPVRGFAWPDPGLPETIRFVPPKNLQVIARQV